MRSRDTGAFFLIDWKRVSSKRKLTADEPSFQDRCGFGDCKDIPDTHFHKYSLQCSIYAIMLVHSHGLDVGDRRRPVEKLRRGERLKRWHVSAANSIRDARCRTVGAGAGGGGGRVGKAFGKGRYRHNALERSGPPRRRGRRTQPTTSKLHVPLVQARCRLRARPRPRACALT